MTVPAATDPEGAPAASWEPGARRSAPSPDDGGWVEVRVPATSANLGPGFDSFGLALEIFDRVRARRAGATLLVDVVGVGADEVPRDASHLVVTAMARAFAAAGEELPAGLQVRCENRIPHGGGLGSSAAAIVAGLLLGRALLAGGPDLLSDAAVLTLASGMEGHPDNVAPALVGGFTVSFPQPAPSTSSGGSATSQAGPDGAVGVIRRDVHPDVRILVFTADQASSTHATRGLLPASVPHADAAANAAAAGLLALALTVEPRYLLRATVDRLHQPYRAPAMPATAALVADLRAAGLAAVVSGAGPSVIALTTQDVDPARWERPGFTVQQVPVCRSGAETTGAGDGTTSAG
ncbi:homoserine kinase [Nakamurella flavida]